MGAPQGYTALGLVGYTDKGTYLASATYNRYNVVLYNGSSYVAIKDGITGVTPSNDGVNWRLFANGFPENGISTDNFQETLKQYISNSGTVNQEGFALDARQGNPNVEGSLAAQLTTLTSGIPVETTVSGTTGDDGRIMSEIPGSAYIVSCSSQSVVVLPFISSDNLYGFALYSISPDGLTPAVSVTRTIKVLYRM